MKKSTLAVERCKTVSTIQKILGGKWKIEIIYKNNIYIYAHCVCIILLELTNP